MSRALLFSFKAEFRFYKKTFETLIARSFSLVAGIVGDKVLFSRYCFYLDLFPPNFKFLAKV